MLVEKKSHNDDTLTKIQHHVDKYHEGQVLDNSYTTTEDILYKGDAVKEAVDRKYLQEISPGQWLYLPEAARIVKGFQDLLREHMVQGQDFQEWIFPRLQRKENIANFGWEIRENLRGELMKVVPNVIEEGQHLPEFYLDPLQCPSFYRYLSLNSPLDPNETPIKVYEVLGGWTYRNEKPERIAK